MTLDELIALARSVASRYRMHAVIAGSLQDDANQLALGLLALLAPDRPCGWDESDVAYAGLDGVHVYPSIHTNADELHWAALVLLRAAESLRAKENKSHG